MTSDVFRMCEGLEVRGSRDRGPGGSMGDEVWAPDVENLLLMNNFDVLEKKFSKTAKMPSSKIRVGVG